MATNTSKILGLSTASDPTGTVYVECVQGGVTKQVSNANLQKGVNASASRYEATDTLDNGTPVSAFRVNRTLTSAISANAHGFRDQTIFGRPTYAYACFDGAATGETTDGNMDHLVSFQSRLVYNSNGRTLLNMYSAFSEDSVQTGSTVTNRYGSYIADTTGGGTLTNQYGIYIAGLTKGGTTNWAIYADGATKSLHKGFFGIGDLSTAPAYQLEVIDADAKAFSLQRTNAATNAVVTAGQVKAKSTGNMTDGFGVIMAFVIQDDASGEPEIAHIGAVRSGADSSGDMVFYTSTAATPNKRMTLTKEGYLLVHNMPTSSAGLPTGALWSDSGTIKIV